MCIEVDSHIAHWNEKDSEGKWVVDKDRQFNLIYSVCFMLVCKSFVLKDGREYDDLAYFIAWDIFDKIERPRDPNHPIKSILNYAKSILPWRKMQFVSNSTQEIFDSTYRKSWNEDRFRENLMSDFESTKRLDTIGFVNDELESISTTISLNIPKQFDVITRKYVYISSCLTIINYIKSKQSDIFKIVNYNLTKDFDNVIKVVVKKSLLDLKNSLNDIIDVSKITEFDYNVIMNSAYSASDRNEEKY